MRKIVFITIPNFTGGPTSQSATCKLYQSEELDKLLEEGWKVSGTSVITPPKAITRTLIQVVLDK